MTITLIESHDPDPNGTLALLYATTLLLVAAVLRRPGAATLAALMFTILRIGLWDFAPWITGEYAAAVGLVVRDNTRGAPIIPGMLPAYLLLAGRRFGGNVWLTVIAAGALTPAVIQLTEPVPALFARLPALFPPLAPLARLGHISLVTIAIGAIGSVLGWIIGYVLRNQERQPAPATTGLGIAQEAA